MPTPAAQQLLDAIRTVYAHIVNTVTEYKLSKTCVAVRGSQYGSPAAVAAGIVEHATKAAVKKKSTLSLVHSLLYYVTSALDLLLV